MILPVVESNVASALSVDDPGPATSPPPAIFVQSQLFEPTVAGFVETDLQGTRLSDAVGDMRVSEFQVIKKQTDTLRISDAVLTSEI